MACPLRTYPLRQPRNYKPLIPRWQLVLPAGVERLFTCCVLTSACSRTPATMTSSKSTQLFRLGLMEDEDPPLANERFNYLDGDDLPGTSIWVCYWNDEARGKRSLQRLSLPSIHSSLPENVRMNVGLWTESFLTPISRLETNYSGLDYLPGLAKLPGTKTAEHELTAYWGAARDRIPESAHDLFEQDDAAQGSRPETTPKGLGQHLVGTNYDHMVHIRSGQFWENCGPEEIESYENNLEPTLRNGLGYLWDNRNDGGAMGLRYLGNRDEAGHTKKETCGAGFFTSLQTLEEWAKKHKSHLAIFLGAIKHAKTFGNERKFRTWHEVSVLKKGEASFEYVNCLPTTGFHVNRENTMVLDSKPTHDGCSSVRREARICLPRAACGHFYIYRGLTIRTGVTGLPPVVVRYPEDRLGRRSEVPAGVDISAEIPSESMSLGTPT
ncbi:phenylacetaldoxime dehydratase [Colletotrichum asianum]|uniref:Phenylacetaldoxime dehydratase n=1 Tax=Colletotrichum asianum TaxID=702518 RepID=A0A8H3W213_9PEZI|nr:phenylacetaldoxime dehydratase [Colletotrichum asianum]